MTKKGHRAREIEKRSRRTSSFPPRFRRGACRDASFSASLLSGSGCCCVGRAQRDVVCILAGAWQPPENECTFPRDLCSLPTSAFHRHPLHGCVQKPWRQRAQRTSPTVRSASQARARPASRLAHDSLPFHAGSPPGNNTLVSLAACAVTTTGETDGDDNVRGPYVLGTKVSHDPDANCMVPSLGKTLPAGKYDCCCAGP